MVSILLIDSGHGCGMPHSVLPPEGFRVMTDIWAQLNIQSDFRVIAARGLTTESFTTGGRAGWGECGGESKDFLIYFLFKEIVQPLQREWLCVLWLRSTLNPMLRHDRFSLSLFFCICDLAYKKRVQKKCIIASKHIPPLQFNSQTIKTSMSP